MITYRPDRRAKKVGALKLTKILEAKYLPEDHMTEVIVYDLDLEYFRGLADAGFAEAREMLEALEKHGSLRLRRSSDEQQ